MFLPFTYVEYWIRFLNKYQDMNWPTHWEDQMSRFFYLDHHNFFPGLHFRIVLYLLLSHDRQKRTNEAKKLIYEIVHYYCRVHTSENTGYCTYDQENVCLPQSFYLLVPAKKIMFQEHEATNVA
jgi:hypothetical protein